MTTRAVLETALIWSRPGDERPGRGREGAERDLLGERAGERGRLAAQRVEPGPYATDFAGATSLRTAERHPATPPSMR